MAREPSPSLGRRRASRTPCDGLLSSTPVQIGLIAPLANRTGNARTALRFGAACSALSDAVQTGLVQRIIACPLRAKRLATVQAMPAITTAVPIQAEMIMAAWGVL